jgi:hypothetical protein
MCTLSFLFVLLIDHPIWIVCPYVSVLESFDIKTIHRQWKETVKFWQFQWFYSPSWQLIVANVSKPKLLTMSRWPLARRLMQHWLLVIMINLIALKLIFTVLGLKLTRLWSPSHPPITKAFAVSRTNYVWVVGCCTTNVQSWTHGMHSAGRSATKRRKMVRVSLTCQAPTNNLPRGHWQGRVARTRERWRQPHQISSANRRQKG